MEIELRGVWHSYDGGLTYALREVNLGFKKPGLYVVVGPNGAGKTTLLKIASLIMKPSQGLVLVNGREFWELRDSEKTALRRNVVFVHDKPILLRGTVKYNVELGLAIRGVKNSGAVDHYVSRYGLEELLRKPAQKLSAGQMKAVSIVRALVLDPPILVLDEPFSFLDEARQGILLEDIVGRAKEGKTTIVATHYMYRELAEVADTVIEVFSGRVRVLR